MQKVRLVLPTALLFAFTLAFPAAAQTPHQTGILPALASDKSLLIVSSGLTLFNIVLAIILSRKTVSFLQMVIIALGSMTAFLHLGIGLRGKMLLLLNGLGYVGLVYAFFLPVSILVAKRQWIRWLLLIYTAVTFVGYFVTHSVNMFTWMGVLTKVIELGLLGLLLVRIWQTRRSPSPPVSSAVSMD